jgi:hypothetical protein
MPKKYKNKSKWGIGEGLTYSTIHNIVDGCKIELKKLTIDVIEQAIIAQEVFKLKTIEYEKAERECKFADSNVNAVLKLSKKFGLSQVVAYQNGFVYEITPDEDEDELMFCYGKTQVTL